MWFCLKFWAENDCQPWHITNAAKGDASFVWEVCNDHRQLLYLKNDLGTYATCHNKTRRLCEGRQPSFSATKCPFSRQGDRVQRVHSCILCVSFSGNGGFLKWGYPKSSILTGMFHDKPSILGIPHCKKPPNMPGSPVTLVVLKKSLSPSLASHRSFKFLIPAFDGWPRLADHGNLANREDGGPHCTRWFRTWVDPVVYGNFRILKWRYCTIYCHILWGYFLIYCMVGISNTSVPEMVIDVGWCNKLIPCWSSLGEQVIPKADVSPISRIIISKVRKPLVA